MEGKGMTNLLNSLVFFEENGKTFYGFRHGGQFIQYEIAYEKESAYGYRRSMPVLKINPSVYQDNGDDIALGQRKLAIMCIDACLRRYGNLTFYSELYKNTVHFTQNDDWFDIDEKLRKLSNQYGGGKIY